MSTKPSASQETILEFVKRAINMLLDNQISDTLILSSHKINSILKDRFGVNFKIDRIGRTLSKIAKQQELKRISTRIPKYELKASRFKRFRLPD